MFTSHLRCAVAGLALAATAPVALVPMASAQPTVESGTAERTISIKGVEPRPDHFFAKGRVSPEYADRVATMQRKVKGATKWRAWHKFRTNDHSRYRREIDALERVGTVCYRVRVKGNRQWATSYSRKVCIQTTRDD